MRDKAVATPPFLRLRKTSGGTRRAQGKRGVIGCNAHFLCHIRATAPQRDTSHCACEPHLPAGLCNPESRGFSKSLAGV